MRQIWKVWRLFWTLLTRTLHAQWVVRRLPEEERPAYRAHRQMTGCRRLCDILGIELGLDGSRPPGRGRLVVCNHFGVLDPIILAAAMPVSFVAKAEMEQWPLIGWVCRVHGVLFVQRERRTTVKEFTGLVQDRLASGVDVLVFPEGTTSPDESIMTFKTGAFEAVADQLEQHVLPVYLNVISVNGEPATGPVRRQVVWSDPELPFTKHCWDLAGLQHIEMKVHVGTPIPVDQRDRKQLAQVAREAVEGLRDGATVPASPRSTSI